MSRELTASLSAEYEDANGVTGSVSIADLIITLATAKLFHTTQTIGTVEEAVQVGDIVSRGTCILVNLDPTNYIEIKVATSGAICAKLFPKGSVAGLNFCILHLGSGAQTPFAIANSGACEMEIFMNPL